MPIPFHYFHITFPFPFPFEYFLFQLMFILYLFIFSSVSSQSLTDISFFGKSREIRGRHLFPNYFSSSPSYFSIPSSDEYAISRIHTHQSELNDVISGSIYSSIHNLFHSISDVSESNYLIKSICSYESEGETFYVINYGSGEGRHEIALNLTMADLQVRERGVRVPSSSYCRMQ